MKEIRARAEEVVRLTVGNCALEAGYSCTQERWDILVERTIKEMTLEEALEKLDKEDE